MGKVVEPEAGSLRGRLLQTLRMAGDTGGLVKDLAVETKAPNTTAVQTAIHDLRGFGHRVDYADGRYFYRGEGVSMSKHPGSNKLTPVCLRRYMARAKQAVRAAAHIKQVVVKPHKRGRTMVRKYERAPQATVMSARPDPRSVQARVSAGKDIFIINQGSLHNALKSLPPHVHPTLRGMSEKVQKFNKMVRLYSEAHQQAMSILDNLVVDRP